ncbi:glucose-6-phosphate isomerase [Candidatus Brocadiaceae bacterium B188]|nr:SHOCT domain-containing protein [Candidatus Brocadia sapporoensis]QQR66904.1 MAG: SHOCT domain-containing protein [Candidatus Brocadia sp.]RZV57819.1 MAG: cupin domain-containing protein [Candidatus Brocadia sp. BROELEC01]TWU53888.1 glucose-6-phosphate isomerase [Candidatus Brocadiaceae bacterium B188]
MKRTSFPRLLISLLPAAFLGCTTVKYYPGNFVESLQHPTKFPEVFSANVQNIEEIASKNPLGNDEDVKITNVGENKNSSMHLIQVRENGEFQPHYHKRHDEVIYVKKGSGIATLDGTRYLIKSGSILQIPSRTVHKFINTGGEPFMAVSIFSPPFDGRDEKFIKEKRVVARGGKEEKRLAIKKSEKPSEQNQASSGETVAEEETQSAVAKSQKVAENIQEESLSEEMNSPMEKPPELPKKISSSERKKKQKGTIISETSSVNINDLHEKLTKLLQLKEEGTISADEYEEKKDALIRGGEIGALPETKGYTKKKISFEDEDVLQESEKPRITDREFSDKAANRMSGLFDEKEADVHKYSAQELPSEDNLKFLEEAKQEGFGAVEDLGNKVKDLTDAMKTKSAPAMSKGISTDDRISELKELYDQELITKEDYQHKLEEITSLQTGDSSLTIPSLEKGSDLSLSDTVTESEKVKDLKELYDQGLITKDDYNFKLKELIGDEKKIQPSDISSEKETENDKLAELKELKKEGIISEEDYEFKKSQLMGN